MINKYIPNRKKVAGSISELKEYIKLVDKIKLKTYYAGKDFSSVSAALETLRGKGYTLQDYHVITVKKKSVEITTKWWPNYIDKCITVIVNLNDSDVYELYDGLDAYTDLINNYKVPNIRRNAKYKALDKACLYSTINRKYIYSASATIGYNETYANKPLTNVYEYDLNSAYASVLLDKIPDFDNYRFDDVVGKDEVGFYLDVDLDLVPEGKLADVVFELKDSPEGLKRWVNKWYNIKKTTTDKNEKAKAKFTLVAAIGYLQKTNPLLRAFVIHTCNNKINKLKDNETLLWNTDAIFTLKPRNDLVIGSNIGEFKVITIDKLYYDKTNYQVGDNIPTYRGVPKEWFETWALIHGRPWCIETDPLPYDLNKYKWNVETNNLEVINYEQQLLENK